jgi:Mn2+/Fe2+ NRAMP family transporter
MDLRALPANADRVTLCHYTTLCRLQTRAYARTTPGKKQAIFYGTWDVSLSLMVAFFVNAAILITAAGQTARTLHDCIPLSAVSSIMWRRTLPRWQK